jgi:hypothetical protein
MLAEFENLRQVPGEDERRLFTDEYFALYVWYRDGGLSGFQLCYDKPRRERAFMWTVDHGYAHYAVDSGEETGVAQKRTPVFSSVSAPVQGDLAERFEAAAGSLEAGLRSFVLEKLGEYFRERGAS